MPSVRAHFLYLHGYLAETDVDFLHFRNNLVSGLRRELQRDHFSHYDCTRAVVSLIIAYVLSFLQIFASGHHS